MSWPSFTIEIGDGSCTLAISSRRAGGPVRRCQGRACCAEIGNGFRKATNSKPEDKLHRSYAAKRLRAAPNFYRNASCPCSRQSRSFPNKYFPDGPSIRHYPMHRSFIFGSGCSYRRGHIGACAAFGHWIAPPSTIYMRPFVAACRNRRHDIWLLLFDWIRD
jgi:hypothetical protein